MPTNHQPAYWWAKEYINEVGYLTLPDSDPTRPLFQVLHWMLSRFLPPKIGASHSRLLPPMLGNFFIPLGDVLAIDRFWLLSVCQGSFFYVFRCSFHWIKTLWRSTSLAGGSNSDCAEISFISYGGYKLYPAFLPLSYALAYAIGRASTLSDRWNPHPCPLISHCRPDIPFLSCFGQPLRQIYWFYPSWAWGLGKASIDRRWNMYSHRILVSFREDRAWSNLPQISRNSRCLLIPAWL